MAGHLFFPLMVLLITVHTTARLDGAEPEINRTPVDDAIFSQIADWYAYDAKLPLRSEIISTQTHDGRELPYLTDKVRFRSIHDQEVVGYFTYQRDTTDTRYPTVILLHGNNRYRGSHDTWTRSWLDILARAGYCVLAIDQYGFGERFVTGKAPNFRGNMGPYELRDLARQHVVDVRRALDYVSSRTEVDTTRIGLMGESMGGFNACLTAGLEERLTAVVLVITGAWPQRIPTNDPFWAGRHTLNFAPRIGVPTLMVYSEHDGVELGQELYDHLLEPKRIVWHDIDDHVILIEDQKLDILNWFKEHLH